MRVDAEGDLSDEDEAALVRKTEREFEGNFHNRHHLFHLAAGYTW